MSEKRSVENTVPVSPGEVREWLSVAIPDTVEEKTAVLAHVEQVLGEL